MTITYTLKGSVYDEARAVSLYAEYEAVLATIAAETQSKQIGLLRDKQRQAWERFTNSAPFVTVADGVPVIPSPEEPIV